MAFGGRPFRLGGRDGGVGDKVVSAVVLLVVVRGAPRRLERRPRREGRRGFLVAGRPRLRAGEVEVEGVPAAAAASSSASSLRPSRFRFLVDRTEVARLAAVSVSFKPVSNSIRGLRRRRRRPPAPSEELDRARAASSSSRSRCLRASLIFLLRARAVESWK